MLSGKRCVNSMVFFVMGIMLLTPPFSSGLASTPIRKFAKAVLEMLVGVGANGRQLEERTYQWKEDLAKAIILLVEKEGPEFKGCSDEIIAAVRSQLETPQKALAYIERAKMSSELSFGWGEWMRDYAESQVALSPGYQQRFILWAKEGVSYVYLETYYHDEIKQLLTHLFDEIGKIPAVLKTEKLEQALKKVNSFFTAETGQSVWGGSKEINHRKMAIALLDKVIPDLEQELIVIRNRAKRYEVVRAPYITHLERLNQKVSHYSRSLHSDRVVSEKVLRDLGIFNDFLMAHVRYGPLEAKKSALLYLIRTNFIGGEHFSQAVVSEILSQPDPVFRHYALACFIDQIKILQGMVCLREEVNDALLAFYMKSLSYFPKDEIFKESIEALTALLVHQDEVTLARALGDLSLLATRKIGVVRGLGALDTPAAFDRLIQSYFQDGFRESLQHPRLFKGYIEVLLGMIDKTHSEMTIDQRRSILSKLLKVMYTSEKELLNKEVVVWGIGEALQGMSDIYQAEAVIFLLSLVKETSVSVGIKKEAILALSKFPYEGEIASLIVSYRTSANSELRAVANIYLLRIGKYVDLDRGVSLLNSPQGELSESLLLQLLDIIGAPGVYDVGYRDPLLRLVHRETSVLVRTKGLRILVRRKDEEAAHLLIDLLGQSCDSEKAQIIAELLANFHQRQHQEILKKTFMEVINLYQRPDLAFDIFHFVEDSILKECFYLLKGEMSLIERLVPLSIEEGSPRFKQFIDLALETIK